MRYSQMEKNALNNELLNEERLVPLSGNCTKTSPIEIKRPIGYKYLIHYTGIEALALSYTMQPTNERVNADPFSKKQMERKEKKCRDIMNYATRRIS